MEIAKSGGLLAVLSLIKAEQDLALTQDRQRSCPMSRPPLPQCHCIEGRLRQISSRRYRWDTRAPTHLTQGAALCHSMREISSEVWSEQLPRAPTKPQGIQCRRESSWAPPQAERLPRSHAPHFGQQSFPWKSHNVEQKLFLLAPSTACCAPRVAPGQTP